MISIVLLALLGAVAQAHVMVNKTLDLSYAPETAMTMKERETQLFRAPLCNSLYINKWVFHLQVYLQNVHWDSGKFGDDNWLLIKVSNKRDMSNIICTNENAPSPLPECSPFVFDKEKWGPGDLYISVKASSGSPTYQYGLNLLATPQLTGYNNIPEGTSVAMQGSRVTGLKLNVLEQVAIPYASELPVELTGQYIVPYCFEPKYDERRIQVTTLVRDDVEQGAGGLATYVCSHDKITYGECKRAVVQREGTAFFDASGGKVNAVSPVIQEEGYGPVFLLVLAQGDKDQKIKFTITAKLRAPAKHSLHEGHGTKVEALVSCLNSKAVKTPSAENTKDEL